MCSLEYRGDEGLLWDLTKQFGQESNLVEKAGEVDVNAVPRGGIQKDVFAMPVPQSHNMPNLGSTKKDTQSQPSLRVLSKSNKRELQRKA